MEKLTGNFRHVYCKKPFRKPVLKLQVETISEYMSSHDIHDPKNGDQVTRWIDAEPQHLQALPLGVIN